MKYIKYFKENLDVDNMSNNEAEKIFENDKWIIFKPKSYQELLYLSDDTDWDIENINSKYHISAGFKPQKYEMTDLIFVNFDKNSKDKYLFDFEKSNFYDIDNNEIVLYDFMENNNELYKIFGEHIDSYNVTKENGEYWLVIPDNYFFSDYFEIDNNYRQDVVEKILSGDSFELFSYNSNDFDVDSYHIKLSYNNIILLRIVLILEKIYNKGDYDYNVQDVEDYNDITNIINEYNIIEFKNILKGIILESFELEAESAAYNNILDYVYDFFELIDNSAKWKAYKNNKYDWLWLKFKNSTSAFRAKFIFNNYDKSYSDEKINYSPSEHEQNVRLDNIYNRFNDIIEYRFSEYNSDNVSGEEIIDVYKYIVENKEKFEKLSDEELITNIKVYKQSKKYNL